MYKRFAAIVAVLMVCMSCVCMTALADDYGIYKSSYVMAGYGSGVGSMAGTGETYGFYGGLIPGSGDIKGCTVRGSYNDDTGKYVIVYQVELVEPVTKFSQPICYIPVTYSMDVSVSYTVMAVGTGGTITAQMTREKLASYDGLVTIYGLNYIFAESDVVPGSVSYVADVSGGLALPIMSTSSTATKFSIAVTIQDPEAVIEYPHSPDKGETMLFPFHFIIQDVPIMLTYMSYIISSPIVATLISIAAAALLLSIIVGFMR